MTEYPAVLTALVPAAIRTALTGHGVRLCGEDVPDPGALLDMLAASAADCLILHMSVADNFGRRRFFREVQKRKPMPVIVIGSKSDAADDGVKKLIRDSLVAALVTDSRALVDELLDALAAVEPSEQPACDFDTSGVEVSVIDSPGIGPAEPSTEAPEDVQPSAFVAEEPSPLPEPESPMESAAAQEPEPQPEPENLVLPSTPNEPASPGPEALPELGNQPEPEAPEEPPTQGKKPAKKSSAPRKPKKAPAPAAEPEPPVGMPLKVVPEVPPEAPPKASVADKPQPEESGLPRKGFGRSNGRGKAEPAPQKYKPPKPSSCQTVAVFQTMSGGGCTWTAAAIAAWLADNGLRTALLGEADLRYLPPRPALDTPYSYAGVDVFYGGETIAEVMRGGYDYVIADIGAIVRQNDGAVLPTQQQAKLDELTRAAVRVFVADAGRTRWIACESVLRMFQGNGLRMSIALARLSPESQQALRRIAKGQTVVALPFLADPFAQSHERDNFCAALFDNTGGGTD